MSSIVEKWREFREWQRRPHQVAPMSEEHHRCHTCGQEFQGNYCPRCGQSARIGRYSFKKAFLLFLDVWGLGNRGMFRTLRDLILRPGYMIRDYLSGMQMAYFPPFKLFFLLTTLSLLVESGMNLKGIDYFDISRDMQQGFNDSFEKTDYTEFLGDSQNAEEVMRVQKTNEQFKAATNSFVDYAQKFPRSSPILRRLPCCSCFQAFSTSSSARVPISLTYGFQSCWWHWSTQQICLRSTTPCWSFSVSTCGYREPVFCSPRFR